MSDLSSPGPASAAASDTPVFRRPTRDDAVAVARALFLADERVDMRTIAQRLGVARATLYRWVPSREQVLEELLEGFAREFLALSRAEAQGEGDDWFLDLLTRLSGRTAVWHPVRGFVAREPALALRLLLGEHGRVRRCLVDGLHDAAADAYPASELARLDGLIEVMVQVATALQWSALAAGDEPSAERIVQIGRTLLAGARAGALQARAAP